LNFFFVEHYEWLIESDCIEIMKDPRFVYSPDQLFILVLD